MDCATVRERLSAYVDGELPAPLAAELADHLTGCGECSTEVETMLRTVRTLREGMMRHEAPDTLRARVRSTIRDESTAATPRGAARTTRRDWRAPWRTLAAAVVIAAVSSALTLVATRRATSRGGEPAVASEVVASHIRSLMPDHLTDIRSNDQHNVKPWFNGRLDYSPAVPRLDSLGFPLIGGRIDYVAGRPVAVVVYGRRQHVLNLFSWPAGTADEAVQSDQSRHGYNVLRWREGGIEHWLVSDLNAAELHEFAERWRAMSGGG